MFNKICVLGCGLIGSSLLRAIEKKNLSNDKWGGVGFSYCLENESELHKKKPVKAYIAYYFGVISVTAEYVWSDFFYQAITVRFGFQTDKQRK